jgi:hypothetical protein
MCFSAPASFGMSALLVPAGVYCVGNALRKNQSLLGLAIIPFVFSAQQFIEGLVWTGIDANNLALSRGAAFAFLFFALSFWPFWIPCHAYLTERDARKKRLLGILTVLGLVGGQVLFVPLVRDPEFLIVKAHDHSIVYNISQAPGFRLMPILAWQFAYVVVVGVPLILSPAPGFTLFGVSLLISAIVSHFVFWRAFVSVWCFFAAALSLLLCLTFRAAPHQAKSTDSAAPAPI